MKPFCIRGHDGIIEVPVKPFNFKRLLFTGKILLRVTEYILLSSVGWVRIFYIMFPIF